MVHHTLLTDKISSDFKRFIRHDNIIIKLPESNIEGKTKVEFMIENRVELIEINFKKETNIYIQISNQIIIQLIRIINQSFVDKRLAKKEMNKLSLRKQVNKLTKKLEEMNFKNESKYLKLLFLDTKLGLLYNYGFRITTRFDNQSLIKKFSLIIAQFRVALLEGVDSLDDMAIDAFWGYYRNLLHTIRDVWLKRNLKQNAIMIYEDSSNNQSSKTK